MPNEVIGFVRNSKEAWQWLVRKGAWHMHCADGQIVLSLVPSEEEHFEEPPRATGASLKEVVRNLQVRLSADLYDGRDWYPEERTTTCPDCGERWVVGPEKPGFLPDCDCFDSPYGDEGPEPTDYLCWPCAARHITSCPTFNP